MTQSIKTLIERLEKASGPDRELDFQIMLVRDGKPADSKPNWTYAHLIPAFTCSIDVALTLAPEGCGRWVDATAPECGIRVEFHRKGGKIHFGDHLSEPIATCIAALKSREAQT